MIIILDKNAFIMIITFSFFLVQTFLIFKKKIGTIMFDYKITKNNMAEFKPDNTQPTCKHTHTVTFYI
jgi:hypothetical protein